MGHPNGLFPSGFPTRTLCTPHPSLIRATYTVHLILFDFTTRTILGGEYRPLSSSLCNFLHSPEGFHYRTNSSTLRGSNGNTVSRNYIYIYVYIHTHTHTHIPTVLSCPYKDQTSSRRFACPISGNIYV